MYMYESMIDMGLKEGQSWPSPAHRTVAAHVLICNPRIRSLTSMEEQVAIINQIPLAAIKKVTFTELYDMGVLVKNPPARRRFNAQKVVEMKKAK
jgi:hypothetical protein